MVRVNELGFARRGALSKLAARHQGSRSGQLTGVVVGLDARDDRRVVVSFDGEHISVLSGPHKLVPCALVAVDVDSTNAPVRVAGPVTARPEGMDEWLPVPDVVVPMPDLGPREFSPEEQAKLDTAVADLDVAQAGLDSARTLLEALGTATTDDEIEAALAAYMGVDPSEVSFNAAIYDAVLTKLLVATEIVTDTMLATGAVTAPKLNVVYSDPVSGFGFSLQPEGLTILDRDGNPAIVLRADMTNYFSVVKDGVAQAFISPDGEIVGQSVAANQSLEYRGVELDTLLASPARGIIAHARNVENAAPGTDSARLLSVTFRTPAEDRKVRVTIRAHGGTSAPRAYFHLRQAEGNAVTNTNSLQAEYYTPALPASSSLSVNWEHERTVSEWGWPYDATITLGVFVRSMDAGKTLNFAALNHQEILVHDTGPAVRAVPHRPYIPATGGGTGGGTPVEPGTRDYSTPFNSNGFRTFPNSGTRHVRANDSVVQGYIAGVHSYGHWYFPSVTSTLNGATDMSGTLTIVNQYTGSSSGMTIGLWAHNYASNPGSFGTATKIADIHVGRGQNKTITLPASVLNGLKAGTIKGFGLSHGTNTSINWYGYFSPSATLRLNYTK